jgi:hypothetical protein
MPNVLDDRYREEKAQLIRTFLTMVLEQLNVEPATRRTQPAPSPAMNDFGDEQDQGHEGQSQGQRESESTERTGVAGFLHHHIVIQRYGTAGLAALFDTTPASAPYWPEVGTADGQRSSNSNIGDGNEGTVDTDTTLEENVAQADSIQPRTSGWPRFCRDDAVLAQFLRSDSFASHLIRSTLAEVVGQFQEIRAEGGEARFEILVLNWLERTVVEAVGAMFAPQFLHDLATC